MPLEYDLLETMQQEVIIEPFVSQDAHGTLSYGPPVPILARVEQGPKMIRTMDGREAVSSARSTLADPTFLFDLRSRFTLPDGTKSPILRVDRSPDELGQPYNVIVYT
jgi:hypothetical protein